MKLVLLLSESYKKQPYSQHKRNTRNLQLAGIPHICSSFFVQLPSLATTATRHDTKMNPSDTDPCKNKIV